MRISRLLILLACVAFIAAPTFAQTTGTLTGSVTQEGLPLPGVTVTATSPNLQGSRSTVTNEAGGYNFGALPPGEYTVRFELAGLQTTTHRTRVNVAQTARIDTNMRVTALTEAITVTAESAAVATTTEVQTNFSQDLIDDLPVPRNIVAVALLAPGVTNGVNGLQISGGQSFDNLYTVDGAVIQENLRGQPHNLFIEDAIQETTVQTGAISAEYGNFTGGVVNTITRSGGNDFDGSFRDSFTNPRWTAKSPAAFRSVGGVPTSTPPPNQIDELNEVYEATLGGRIIRDRLWFFTAGRFTETESQLSFSNAGDTYGRTFTDQRLEGKLTASITPSHNIVGTYMEQPTDATNGCQIGCFDASVLDPIVENPRDFQTLHYNGILTNNFLLEAKYSALNFAFVGYGGEDTNPITGTPIRHIAPGFGTTTNEPYFCGNCGDEFRNNDTIGLKATYFLGTRSLGSHSIVAGGERWHETRRANNYQSPSGYVFIARSFGPTRDPNGNTLMSVRGGNDYMINYRIPEPSQGSDLNTDAIYINDKWDLNSHWSFNLGARYDRNHSADSLRRTIADDSLISPRLGATYDVFGNGRLRLNAGYGTYVGRLAETVANVTSPAGNNASFSYLYEGPNITDVSPEEAMRQVWAWFDSRGGIEEARLIGQFIPGSTGQFREPLTSPNVNEFTVGASTQLGRGYLRADFIQRDWQDFYGGSTNVSNGRVTLPNGNPADLTLYYNSNDFTREYQAIQLQGQYPLGRRVNVGANYTWSELTGNLVGESTSSGPYASADRSHYPEYTGFSQYLQTGFLTGDQTHKVRAWAAIDVPTFLGNFNFGVLQRFDSGAPYELYGTIDVRENANFYGTGQAGGVANPGYVTPPTSVGYYFTDLGALRWEDETSTAFSVRYTTNPGWLAGVGLFVDAELINAFDEAAQVSGNTQVLTHLNDASLRRFNPMAGDVPQEGVHYRRGPLFGLPTAHTTAGTAGSFQQPRTYRFSVGARF